jgi:hypothetical protein
VCGFHSEVYVLCKKYDKYLHKMQIAGAAVVNLYVYIHSLYKSTRRDIYVIIIVLQKVQTVFSNTYIVPPWMTGMTHHRLKNETYQGSAAPQHYGSLLR